MILTEDLQSALEPFAHIMVMVFLMVDNHHVNIFSAKVFCYVYTMVLAFRSEPIVNTALFEK